MIKSSAYHQDTVFIYMSYEFCRDVMNSINFLYFPHNNGYHQVLHVRQLSTDDGILQISLSRTVYERVEHDFKHDVYLLEWYGEYFSPTAYFKGTV